MRLVPVSPVSYLRPVLVTVPLELRLVLVLLPLLAGWVVEPVRVPLPERVPVDVWPVGCRVSPRLVPVVLLLRVPLFLLFIRGEFLLPLTSW